MRHSVLVHLYNMGRPVPSDVERHTQKRKTCQAFVSQVLKQAHRQRLAALVDSAEYDHSLPLILKQPDHHSIYLLPRKPNREIRKFRELGSKVATDF
jgi:hypothetical protein